MSMDVSFVDAGATIRKKRENCEDNILIFNGRHNKCEFGQQKELGNKNLE